MHGNASRYEADGTKKFIMGGSAGGNLAAAVALKYASSPALRASGLIIACPSTCDRRALPEEYKLRWTPELYADAPMIGREIVDWSFGNASPKASHLLLLLTSY
jgi:acetyl esterase/lipase